MTKELQCKICNTNKVKVSDQALSGVCSDCVRKQQEAFDREAATTALQPKKKSSRYHYESNEKKGFWSKLIDPELIAGKSTKDIVKDLIAKQPDADPLRVRQLVYIRRGALKALGKLPTHEGPYNNGGTPGA